MKHTVNQRSAYGGLATRLVRRIVRLVLALAALVVAHVLLAEVLVLVARRNPGWRRRILRPYNAAILSIAGRRFSPYAVLKHVGRRSGRAYQNPLGAFPVKDGFVLALAYGPDVDWCRNVLAAGRCTLKWMGMEYALERPEVVPVSQAMRFHPVLARLLTRSGAQQCLWLHRSSAVSAWAPETNATGEGIRAP
jgi:deazaflavin-dependent oxidoreductase (nitroreductase family)